MNSRGEDVSQHVQQRGQLALGHGEGAEESLQQVGDDGRSLGQQLADAGDERGDCLRVAAAVVAASENEVDESALELCGLGDVLRVRRRRRGDEMWDGGEKNGRDGGVVEVDVCFL